MKNMRLSLIIMLLTFFSSSCTENPKSDQAEVSEVQEISTTDNASTLPVDKQASEVSWVGTRPGKRHNGTIAIEEGMLEVVNDNLVGGTILLNMKDIDVKDLEGEDKQKLTGHLQSADFFDTETYPEAIFEISSIEKIDASQANSSGQKDTEFQIANPTHKISGNLTLRGNTHGITFPARINVSNDKVQAEAKFNIDRTQWGVSYQDEAKAIDKAKDKFIYNTVNVGFNIVAQK